jgi:DNA-binding LacI/PurR family transcriptional regulator
MESTGGRQRAGGHPDRPSPGRSGYRTGTADPDSDEVSPTLTTVRNPAYEAGSTAGDLLMSRMSGRYTGDGRTVVLPCPLVTRGTA